MEAPAQYDGHLAAGRRRGADAGYLTLLDRREDLALLRAVGWTVRQFATEGC